MAARKGHKKAGGRKKGTPNKATAEIRTAAQVEGPAVLKKLVALTKSEDERVVLAACNSILDRGYGRPAQALSGIDGEKVAFSFTMIVAPEKE